LTANNDTGNPQEHTMNLGDRIKERREEKTISAAELARLADVSKAYLSELENRRAERPSVDILFRIAKALGTTVADLLGEEIRPTTAAIPPALQEFADQERLPAGDVRMLATIRFRGEQPRTVEDWRFLYESIKRSIRPGS
jgi:transcriptional regulator with XRE-family HTH domain